jgi:ATP-dependent DNA helicase DinG
MDRHVNELKAYSLALRKTGILTAAPAELLEHPQVKLHQSKDAVEDAEVIASAIGQTCRQFTEGLNALTTKWSDERPESARPAIDSVRNYQSFVRDFGEHAIQVVCPIGVSVSHVGQDAGGARLRQDIVGLSEPLDEMIWQRTPYALLSATLAVDGGFDFIRRTLGIKPDFEEILPTPFDYAHQAALYAPKAGKIPDPTLARKEGTEPLYYDALAREVQEIILAAGGRTLALFHSRKEMEEVASRMNLPDELPIYMQFKSGAASVGERFKKNIHASLFALRSFWTGFDAPGETLSCVILARVPFEVPIEPSAIARLAYLQTKGEDPFQCWTLPMAKMMIRQGAGRLIRTAEDKGVIALLDPRLRTKRYGEEIIANLPNDMRTFDDIGDAVGWIGLESDLPSPMA